MTNGVKSVSNLETFEAIVPKEPDCEFGTQKLHT
jgi:hypothetical protein